MSKQHEIAAPVLAIPCWTIYADYDGNAPDTKNLIWCATEELATEVCELLNKTPQRWSNLAYVDGWESWKRFWFKRDYRLTSERVRTSVKEVFEKDVEHDEDEESKD